ncbi:MAG: hypothetical protein QXK67_01350 [Pyrobaculum sp.]
MVSDDLLIRYFHKLEERGLGQWVERAIPNREVFEELSRFHGLSLEEAVRRLVEKLRSVAVPEMAEEVEGWLLRWWRGGWRFGIFNWRLSWGF